MSKATREDLIALKTEIERVLGGRKLDNAQLAEVAKMVDDQRIEPGRLAQFLNGCGEHLLMNAVMFPALGMTMFPWVVNGFIQGGDFLLESIKEGGSKFTPVALPLLNFFLPPVIAAACALYRKVQGYERRGDTSLPAFPLVGPITKAAALAATIVLTLAQAFHGLKLAYDKKFFDPYDYPITGLLAAVFVVTFFQKGVFGCAASNEAHLDGQAYRGAPTDVIAAPRSADSRAVQIDTSSITSEVSSPRSRTPEVSSQRFMPPAPSARPTDEQTALLSSEVQRTSQAGTL